MYVCMYVCMYLFIYLFYILVWLSELVNKDKYVSSLNLGDYGIMETFMNY